MRPRRNAARSRDTGPGPFRGTRSPAHVRALYVVGVAIIALLLVPSGAFGTAIPNGLRSGASGPLQPSVNRTPIQHVVILMMENNAFDVAFGLYPALENGTLAPHVTIPNNLGNASPEFTCPGLYPQGRPCPTDRIQVVPNGTFYTADPVEGYAPSHVDWNRGGMNGWLLPGGSGVAALNTYSIHQMAPEWVLAQEYALGDNYFASALTETNPNRLIAIAGYSPVTNDYGPPPFVPYDRTIFAELAHYGLTSGYYLDDPSGGTGILGYLSDLPSNSPSVQSYAQFESESQNGTLPTLSWVLPLFGGLPATTYSQHPPGSVLAGEMWMLYMVNEVMTGKDWNSTAIVVTYDEGGEYYDHVAPPYLDGGVLGERVPLIVISPYSKEDYVSHTVLNHASWIAFLDYNWGLPALNGFVADSNLPLDLFDFAQSPRAPFPLSATRGFPVPRSIPFPPPSGVDLAPLFPQPFQLPLPSLNYSLTGSSAITLRSLGAGLYTIPGTPNVPWYASAVLWLLAFAFVATVAAAWIFLRRWPGHSRRKRDR